MADPFERLLKPRPVPEPIASKIKQIARDPLLAPALEWLVVDLCRTNDLCVAPSSEGTLLLQGGRAIGIQIRRIVETPLDQLCGTTQVIDERPRRR